LIRVCVADSIPTPSMDGKYRDKNTTIKKTVNQYIIDSPFEVYVSWYSPTLGWRDRKKQEGMKEKH